MNKKEVVEKLEFIISCYNRDECPIVTDLINDLEEYIKEIK